MIYEPTKANLILAGDRIRSGDVVAFPTETVYGLGADAFHADAVKKIFEIKKRPNFNPLIVHLASHEQLPLVARIEDDERLKSLLERIFPFWPGPLSVVLPKQPRIPLEVTGGLDTVAIRIPRHPVAQELLRVSGCPIAAPSANMFSEVSPTSAAHVEESFGDAVPFILDGGACAVGLESTVLSLINDPPALLRPGAVTWEELTAALGAVSRKPHPQDSLPRSPGMLRRHYSPHTRLALRGALPPSEFPAKTGLISFSGQRCEDFEYRVVKRLSSSGDLNEAAARLFDCIRELDKLSLDLIVVDTCDEKGIGLAIMDRLRRASEK